MFETKTPSSTEALVWEYNIQYPLWQFGSWKLISSTGITAEDDIKPNGGKEKN